ncbi:MAG: extracellular solute-binding protein, partial [Candidatus Sumerlaeia bacterium]|nr:extracellular solute-binding protein [Candidatus Sumerlaeia bacterium]
EGLTCNALEWQASEGGGVILAPDGTPQVNTAGARRAFERARDWVGTISPRGVLTYQEEESRLVFHQGNAAFHRNWPYAFALAASDESPIRGKFNVTTLPSGEEGSAATLGGWGLAVSSYTNHPEEAAAFVAFLSTREAQRRRALGGGYLATRMDVYDDPEVTAAIPYFQTMREVFETAVTRPSRQAGPYYNEVSAAYYRAVHSILTGDVAAEEALEGAERRLRSILD